MERYSDEAIRIIDELHTERLDYQSEYIPLIDAAQRLDAYEATGVEPENICALQEELNQYKKLGDLDRLREAVTRQKEYEQFMERWQESVKIAGAVKDIGAERIAEMVQADRDGRCVVLPTKEHADEDGEKALKHAMLVLDVVNSGANRYTVDAIAEKLAREASGKTVEEMEGE